MLEEIIIYVAGNPDLYPLEYYDAADREFHGLIPELLKEFSAQSDYDVRYYSVGEKDIRGRLAEDLQVDLISGCTDTEDFRHEDGKEILLFDTSLGSEKISYYVLLSETAPESLDGELRSFLNSVTWQDKTEILLGTEMRQADTQSTEMVPLVIMLSLFILLLAGGIIVLIRHNRQRVRQLIRKNETDEFTGIGNREYLIRNYHAFINDKNRILYNMYCFHIEEALKQIDGQSERNEFMRHAAAVLLNYTADTDILARISEEDFVLLRLSPGDEEMEEWVLPVLERIRCLPEENGTDCGRKAAAGIYRMHADDYDLDEIIFRTVQCAQFAWNAGKEYQICTEEAVRQAMEERSLEGDINKGLESGEFQLYIQFYVDGGKRRIAGGEALARWEHSERGFLSPGQFVPLMEKKGLIISLDYYLLEKTCSFLEKMEMVRKENFFLSCNFSPATFAREDFSKKCKAIIEKYQFDRRMLVLEITGNSEPNKICPTDGLCADLREMGVRLALDNFGKSMVSVWAIQNNHPDILKLDKSLIEHSGTIEGNAVLHGMIQIGKELGVKVIAEGVEQEQQADFLQQAGCDILQGFCFYHPVPEWEAKRILKNCKADEEGLLVCENMG